MTDDALALTAQLAAELARNDNRPDPRALPVRFSRLKSIAQSPAHYLAACQAPQGESSLVQRLGSGTHAIVLGTPRVVRYSDRRAGKTWELFRLEHADAIILNDREWAEASAMAASILAHDEACKLLHEGTAIEQPIDWEFSGRACSSRPDAFTRTHVAELKTARSVHPAAFQREALGYRYHVQLAAYQHAIERVIGVMPPSAYIVAVEKKPPHVVQVYKLTDRAIEEGRKTWRAWFERLLQCEAADHWPAYSETILDLDCPDLEMPAMEPDADGQLEI